MQADTGKEQVFIDDVDAFDIVARDTQALMSAMESWLLHLESDLGSARLSWPGLQSHHPLAGAAGTVDAAVEACRLGWAQQRKRLEPAQALARSFDDKVVLLVFGKFNAGKSSFCNLLADRFASHGKTVEHFFLEAGSIVETVGRFKEGVSETTACLQGVRLGGKLILIDTPGLHSVTPENAALTQLFTDSADAVLWLTSSTSPGQVQELDELARELHRSKPLLPVLTRSDVYDEDEVDGAICKVLCNKTPANRALQEADVAERALAKLAMMGVAGNALRTPVSISSLLAREHGQTAAALADAGFERLYAELAAIVEPALSYKRRKHAEILLHHLEESVVGAWRSELMPHIGALHALADASIGALGRIEAEMANAIWRDVVPQLPALLDACLASADWQSLLGRLSQAVRESHARQAGLLLDGYHIDRDAVSVAIGPGAEEPARGPADVDVQGLYTGLTAVVLEQALRLSELTVAQSRSSVEQLDKLARRLEDVLDAHEARLAGLKAELRSRFG